MIIPNFNELPVMKGRCSLCHNRTYCTAVPPDAWLCAGCWYRREIVKLVAEIERLKVASGETAA